MTPSLLELVERMIHEADAADSVGDEIPPSSLRYFARAVRERALAEGEMPLVQRGLVALAKLRECAKALDHILSEHRPAEDDPQFATHLREANLSLNMAERLLRALAPPSGESRMINTTLDSPKVAAAKNRLATMAVDAVAAGGATKPCLNPYCECSPGECKIPGNHHPADAAPASTGSAGDAWAQAIVDAAKSIAPASTGEGEELAAAVDFAQGVLEANGYTETVKQLRLAAAALRSPQASEAVACFVSQSTLNEMDRHGYAVGTLSAEYGEPTTVPLFTRPVGDEGTKALRQILADIEAGNIDSVNRCANAITAALKGEKS